MSSEVLSDYPNERQRNNEAVSSDSLRQYLNEIGKTPRLNAEEEVELSKAMEAGLMAGNLLNSEAEQLSEQEIAELEWLAEDGARAREQMINANLRLVVSQARRYTRRADRMEMTDLIQHGSTGLIKAVEKFDYQKGFKFSTYAVPWISQAIAHGITHDNRTIRLPHDVAEQANKMGAIKSKLSDQYGRELSDEELAEEMGLPLKKVQAIKAAERREPISLDRSVGDDDNDFTVGDLAITRANVDIEADIVEADGRSQADLLLDKLDINDRDREIFTAQFGLSPTYGYGNEVNRKILSENYNITTERVRQVENKVRGKLVALLDQHPELRDALN